MNDAAERERDLAERLLAWEAGTDQSPEGLADATERCFDRLHHRLVDLIGPAGFDALVKRTLYLAGAECPCLKTVVVEVQVDVFRLQGLRSSVEGRDPAQVRDGLVSMLAAFLWLLVTFVGDNLCLRLIRRAWPEIPPEKIGFGAEGNQA